MRRVRVTEGFVIAPMLSKQGIRPCESLVSLSFCDVSAQCEGSPCGSTFSPPSNWRKPEAFSTIASSAWATLKLRPSMSARAEARLPGQTALKP
eukprot:4570650-Pyramimonas_sp.AAC.1